MLQNNCTNSQQDKQQNNYLYTFEPHPGLKFSFLETLEGDIKIIYPDKTMSRFTFPDENEAKTYITANLSRWTPIQLSLFADPDRCHFCELEVAPGHVTDPCGLIFCNESCLDLFEASIEVAPSLGHLLADSLEIADLGGDE